MKHILLMAGFALAVGTASLTFADDTEHHTTPGHQNNSEAYEQKAASAKPAARKEKAAQPDGKRLPGRDCEFYEGATRQHSWPQYEIGNAGRPECPEPAKQ